MVKVSIEEMTRAEFKEILDDIEIAVVPVASTEQHGPHLPMRHDMASVLYVARRAAERLHPKVVLTPPPVMVGISPHHMNWPGSLTLTPETFMNAIFEVCKSLRHHGIEKVIILNGHGGNMPAIRLVGYRVRDELGMKVAAFSYWEVLPQKTVDEVIEEKISPGHAGEFETSTAMVIHPDLVRKVLIPKGAERPPHLKHMILNQEEVSPEGVEINSSLGTPEKGKIILDAIIDELEKYFKRFMEL